MNYEKLSKSGRTPQRSTPEAAGYDVIAAEKGVIAPGQRRKFKVDLATKPALGFHMKIYNRSSMACDKGVFIPGTPMIVDRDFRGNIMLTLRNTTDEEYPVRKGDRIAQAMVDRSYKIHWVHQENLQHEETGRDPAGFGTTGR